MPETKTALTAAAPRFVSLLAAAKPATEEEGGGVWIPVLPTGEWDTSRQWYVFGIEYLKLDEADLQECVAHFESQVIGRDVFVDEDHRGGKAFGWIEGMRADADGLWAHVTWTPPGNEAIDQRLYRYTSAEFHPAEWPYFDAASGKKIPNVIRSVALTNDPFFEMGPVATDTSGKVGAFLGPACLSTHALGATEMPEPSTNAGSRPPAGGQQDLPAAGADELTALRAERDRLAADKARLEAEQATAKREKSLADITALFAAVKQGDSQLSEAHAKRLADAAMDIPEDKREAHVAAQIEAMEKGMVPQGEVGGTSPAHIISGGISPALVATARRLGLDPAFVFAAANRGPGGALDIEGARAGVGRISPLAASVEMPSLSYQETMVLIEGFFVAGYESTPALTSDFANRVVSNQRTIDYRALGGPPRMREWLDEIQGAVLNTLAEFPVTVRDWEATVEIPVSELQADKLGQYAMRIQQMGALAKQHPDELLAALMAAAESTLCYDGQNICDTDHSEGNSGTQSNFLTTGYDDDDLADISLSLGAAVAAFNGFKDDRGQYLRIGSRPDAVFDVLVRPAVLHLFRTIATADVISSSSNGWKGRIRPMALPELTVASDFYVAYTEGPVKPFIAQYQNEPSALKSLGPDSEHAKKSGRAWFSTQGNYTVAPGDWRYIIKLQKA